MSKILPGQTNKVPPQLQEAEHIFWKVWFTNHPKHSTWVSKSARTRTSASFSFLVFYFAAFISQCLLLFHLPWNGKCEHFDKWPERWSSFPLASFLRISEFFCEIQFGKLLYQGTKQKKAHFDDRSIACYLRSLRFKGKIFSQRISWYTCTHQVTP